MCQLPNVYFPEQKTPRVQNCSLYFFTWCVCDSWLTVSSKSVFPACSLVLWMSSTGLFKPEVITTLPFLFSPALISFLATFFFDISLATFPKSSGDSGFPLEPFIAQFSLLPSELSSLGTRSLKMHAGECPFSVYDLLLIAHYFWGQNSYCWLQPFTSWPCPL